MQKIASVVISNSVRAYDREYSYMIPHDIQELVSVGKRVIVPFGKSNTPREALVVGVTEEDTDIEGLKSVKKLIDKKPVLDERMIRLAGYIKEKYICTYWDAIKCILPAGTGIKSLRIVRLIKEPGDISENSRRIINMLMKMGNECEYHELRKISGLKSFSKYISALKNEGIISVTEEYSSRVSKKTVRAAFLAVPVDEIVDIIETNRIKRIQQIRVLELLMENEYIAVADILRFAGVSSSVLDTLKKYGYIDFMEVEVTRDPLKNKKIDRTFPLKPNSSQEKALKKLITNISESKFHEALLHGVTGSGKTEVYMQLIEEVINRGRQAIVLVPEISLTPQMVERFMGRFGEDVAVLHSRLSLGERYDQWRLIKEGRIKIAVGARSAVFAPFKKLGAIIIDEEHESTYKSEITPKYHAADIARERCKIDDALLLLGSATPSVETYFKAVKGDIQLIKLDDRVNNASMPKVELVDMRRELEEGNRSMFSRRLVSEISANIEHGQQTMIFLNRRGYSSFVLCRTCGHSIKCVNCNITLTYHSIDDRLICHYCGYTIKMPKLCPRCESRHIRQFGTGTQKVEEEVLKRFKDGTVIRMDMDTTTGKESHEKILQTFREKNINIMVGTQMIAKGHDFPNVTLVGVLAADSMLNMGDYRCSERTFQLITQVAGRAGRGEIPGRAIIQAYNTDDFSIKAACRHDYHSYYTQEIMVREKLVYPPFTNIATVILSGANDRHVFERCKILKKELAENFNKLEASCEVLGPMRPPLTRVKNRYRWRIIIKCTNIELITKVLGEVSDAFNSQRRKINMELGMDINPMNML